jgi:hypothetical protein
MRVRTRLSLVAAGISAAGLVAASPAFGVGSTLTPGSQSIASGGTAVWGGAWGDDAPYNVSFAYGDGQTWTATGTTSTSQGWSHSFFSCTGQDFQQHLHVQDNTGATSDSYAVTHVSRGHFCAPTK